MQVLIVKVAYINRNPLIALFNDAKCLHYIILNILLQVKIIPSQDQTMAEAEVQVGQDTRTANTEARAANHGGVEGCQNLQRSWFVHQECSRISRKHTVRLNVI